MALPCYLSPCIPASARTITKLAALYFLVCSTGMPAWAQSALDGFDPNANGTVRTVVMQPDGKILLGGDFTSLAPNGGPAVTRNRIARLNANARSTQFLIRTQLERSMRSSCRPTARSSRVGSSTGRAASADRHAISSPGWMRPPERRMASIPTRMESCADRRANRRKDSSGRSLHYDWRAASKPHCATERGLRGR